MVLFSSQHLSPQCAAGNFTWRFQLDVKENQSERKLAFQTVACQQQLGVSLEFLYCWAEIIEIDGRKITSRWKKAFSHPSRNRYFFVCYVQVVLWIEQVWQYQKILVSSDFTGHQDAFNAFNYIFGCLSLFWAVLPGKKCAYCYHG